MLFVRRVESSRLLPSGRHFQQQNNEVPRTKGSALSENTHRLRTEKNSASSLCRTPSSFYPVFFDFVLSASRLARALRISGFPSAQALSIVILLKRHLSRSRIKLQS